MRIVLNRSFLAISVQIATMLWCGLQAEAQTTYYPARGVYNGFLDQINILECDNAGDRELNPSLAVFDQTGKELAALKMRLTPNGSQHVILNDLANIKDSYGTYRISLNSDEQMLGIRLACRTSFYRNSAAGSAKPYDFAYVLPVRNPDTGVLSGGFNSFNPAGGTEPTYNWLSVVNMDTRPLRASVQRFAFDGTFLGAQLIDNLTPGSRVDVALGHDRGQVVGSYRIEPLDDTVKYQAFVMRYGVDGAALRFAFPLRALAGACAGNSLQLSTMGSESTVNYLEVVNLNFIQIPVTIIIRDRFGAQLSSETQLLAPNSQYHLYTNPIIDPAGTGNVGSAQVLCKDPSDRLVTQSLYYGRSNRGAINWGYASQEFSDNAAVVGSKLFAPVNTFLGMANWLKLANTGVATEVAYGVFNQKGETAAEGEQALALRSTADIGVHALLPADSVGSIRASATVSGSKFSGELLRVLPNADGTIGTIMQVPAVVQRGGISGQSSSTNQPSVGFIGDPQSLDQYRDSLTYQETAHLLTRAAFGATFAESQAAQQRGLQATIGKLMTFVSTQGLDDEAYKYVDGTPDSTQGPMSMTGIQRWWVHQMLNTPNPLKERMTLILHDLFAMSCSRSADSRIAPACYHHAQLLRSHALGNFRDLAEKMTVDYAMLLWLNGNVNTKGTPDENYSREFWELFSLGEQSKHTGRNRLYNSADIVQSARALTGWTAPIGAIGSPQVPKPTPVFVASRHDSGEKVLWENTYYEQRGNFGYLDVVDKTLARPEAAEWIAKRLFSAFVHDHPSPAVVNQLADTIRAHNWNLAPVVRKILLSEAMFSVDARKTRIKDGLTFGIGFARSTGIPVQTIRFSNFYLSDGMGTEALAPPSVNGWPISKYKGASLSEYFLGWSPRYVNLVRTLLKNADTDFTSFSYDALLPEPAANATQLVDYFAKVLDVRLSGTERSKLIAYVNSQRNNAGTVTTVQFDPTNPIHLRQKIPGLLWLLAQHEEYFTY